MALPQMPAFTSSNNQPFENGNPPPPGALDSITLGQLRSMVGSAPKPKQSYYDFRYEDEDTVFNEIEEFYSYIEVPHVAENFKAWEGSFSGDWIKSSFAQRKAHVEVLLESLEHKDPDVRFTNARRLLYVLQGTFAETTSPEHQLHWIIENSKVVRAANGLSNIVEAFKIANSKHDLLCSLSDADADRFNISPSEKADCIEEVNTELSVYLGMLYLLIEVFKGYDEFSEELMSLDPPLPVYLFQAVSGMRDKSAKGFPVKKLLLVLWKSILAACGGIRELSRVKKLSRELAGLPIIQDEPIPIKSSPFDVQAFRQETSVKYPTFTPPPPPLQAEVSPTEDFVRPPARSVPPLKLASAFSPIPVRHHYHHGDDPESQHPSGLPNNHNAMQNAFQTSNPPYIPAPTQQPLTPAPTPPPSPKPKKQQYQTDQNRPFLFPFSRRTKDARLVPFAIDEADKLYNRHMHISVALWQMWKTREECMIAESGLEHMPGSEGIPDAFDTTGSGTSGGVSSTEFGPGASAADRRASVALSRDDTDDFEEDLPDVLLLDNKIAEAEAAIKNADAIGDRTERRKAKERKEDFLRLKRVEQIYSAVLPVLPNWALVILKLLLATVSASNSNQPPPSATSGGFPPGVSTPAEQQPPAPPPTLDEIDVMRHREINYKAVSAILLLTLKWFKASHIMKFHHLGHLLVDNNCLLLILKMFSLHEFSTTIISKADSPDHNFFRYCQLNFATLSQSNRPEDNMLNPPRHSVSRTTIFPNGQVGEEEIELLTDFSWRNFFSTINFVKIMHKLSKSRSHRILLLVQYKISAILKRILKVSHPMLQLQVLKLIKSQVPYCGRKWRQSNMKVITSIYLNCRPDLRDEWLTGMEVDDVQDALGQEQALRKLVKFYNNKRYGATIAHASGQAHRRSSSISVPLEGLYPGPELSAIVRPVGTPNIVEADVFPPLRSQAPDPSIFLPYTTEDIAFEDEYEEYLSDLGMSDESSDGAALFGGTSAWHRLPHMGSELADGISDSESIASIGELGDEARMDGGPSDFDREAVDENLNNWEHMSPKTMAALPKSPAGAHRRSSSGSSLRPVLPFGLDDASAVDLDIDDEDEPEMGPIPREQSGPFAAGAGVDEVEYAYGL